MATNLESRAIAINLRLYATQFAAYERDQAALARIGGREYTRRLYDLTTRQQPIRMDDLDRWVRQDAESLFNGRSYLTGGYSEPYVWADTEGNEHRTPATFHGLTHNGWPRRHVATVPESAFDWPIYRAAMGLDR